ncbi:unnamed protein product [Caenorhabditis brenneri]
MGASGDQRRTNCHDSFWVYTFCIYSGGFHRYWRQLLDGAIPPEPVRVSHLINESFWTIKNEI